jgi:hypothetical protein
MKFEVCAERVDPFDVDVPDSLQGIVIQGRHLNLLRLPVTHASKSLARPRTSSFRVWQDIA